MRLTKQVADTMSRHFRAHLNHAAKDGLIHENFYYKGENCVIHFAVEAKANKDIDRLWIRNVAGIIGDPSEEHKK